MMPAYRPIRERFFEKVITGDGCWKWSGYRNPKGYGTIKGEGVERPILAHRASWEIHNGPIPDGLCVLHSCDNPECTNPRHLFLGTITDNNADMHAKGRSSGGRVGGKRSYSDETVRTLRAVFAETGSAKIAASALGVNYPVAWAICVGKRRRSVT